MTITSFEPNATGSALILTLDDAENATIIKLWTDRTYKNYTKAIDLSDKLNNTSAQTITIEPNDINETFFKGIYFIQVADNNSLSEAITGYTVSYQECILNKLMSIGLCEECLEKESTSLNNANILLTTLQYATNQGFIEEAKNIITTLDKFCSDECKTCGKYSHITNNTYYDYNT